MSPVLIAPMLASLFGVTKTSPEAGMETSDQPIEVGADVKSDVKTGSHSIEECEVSYDKEVPLPLQGSAKLSLEVGPAPEIEET